VLASTRSDSSSSLPAVMPMSSLAAARPRPPAIVTQPPLEVDVVAE
jgi:hypothetical protein